MRIDKEMSEAMKANAEILIVEDSLTQAKRLERLLVENGYIVHVARNGAEGLEVTLAKKPTVVISTPPELMPSCVRLPVVLIFFP